MEHDERALRDACGALWLATVSLMTAFMKTPAPAQRHMIACRISANFATLCEQGCFATPSRTSFARLSARWKDTADHLAAPARLAARDRAPVL